MTHPASKIEPELLKFPLLLSPRMIGIRCLAIDGKPLQRSLQPVRNRYVQQAFRQAFASRLHGLEGVLVVGKPHVPDVWKRSHAAIMKEDGTPEFFYYVFDRWNSPSGYVDRMDQIRDQVANVPWIRIVPGIEVSCLDAVRFYEALYSEHGYAGVVLRRPDSLYAPSQSNRVLTTQDIAP